MAQRADSKGIQRRDFLKSAAVSAGLTILPASVARGSAANSKLELGIVGCGGRGPWIGKLFEENSETKVVAVHDYFRDRVTAAGDTFGVAPDRRYVGLDGYKELVASSLDAVAVISPPYFHPAQAVTALEAGKHLYLAKPIAVDVPGCMAIVDAAKKVEDKQTALVDFQTRNNEFFRGAAQRVHEGMIGDPVSGQFSYHCGRLGIKTPPGTEAARMRNWVFDKALSGDIIVEQNIHVLDVANWYLQGHPVKAYGTGGRKARTDVGDCWDHFLVTYWYPNDVLIDFSSGQFCEGYSDLCMRLFGSSGTVDSHYGGNVVIRGKSAGWRGGDTKDIYQQGAINNIHDFCASILDGKYLNNTQESANSTMTSILGRIAAYENRVVTWDEMVAANTRLDANLNLPADGPDQSA
ncbi:MAG TPA: Gfo/Idh/MocA family oxidoreductase [Candidatus Hydrogenedentes bacterium]|nr:Gfo/Idh/MocA family oxidoreductase [Candidatus Hydrogenedentota bacterium]HPG68321.1 Gfo/Idh/MocA family oxidoreductase [Candidatus Hydrogenedentota bacterium]